MCSRMSSSQRRLNAIGINAQAGELARKEQRPTQSISVLIPVYRSEAILPELIRRLEPVLVAIAEEL